MCESIADYARVVQPLQQRLDIALSKSNRTKRVAPGIQITLTGEEQLVYAKVKELLTTSTALALPDDSSTTIVCSDAKDSGWAVLMTQVKKFDAELPVTEQHHNLLAYLSGTFKGAQLNWTVIEKEAYPIVVPCEKLNYLLMRSRPFCLFCDHRNLIHVFAPHVSIKKHIRGTLLRWSLKLLPYRYIIDHRDGVANVWMDMLSRLAGQPTTTINLKRVATRSTKKRREPPKTVDQRTLRPLDDERFVWPSLGEIVTAQRKYAAPPTSKIGGNGVLLVENLIWIPSCCNDLNQSLCVIAHYGAQGYRGDQAMVNHWWRMFHIPYVSVIHKFVSSCLLCPHVKGGRIVQVKLSNAMSVTGSYTGVFLSMSESLGTNKYLLVLKDHATQFW
ncbi:hypothetical protein PHMEG_00015539 [Phytophthora megakarya]|uniref:Reverse transcriptase RNase H-like domain-containing protein n=1 Tax=Phytophthora megakarya TaxID=4795 RepID=A0A225W3K5_9STRA|nr:hypothetical protein PHMEG_00015539 [Phytophthora megakarya]